MCWLIHSEIFEEASEAVQEVVSVRICYITVQLNVFTQWAVADLIPKIGYSVIFLPRIFEIKSFCCFVRKIAMFMHVNKLRATIC